MTRKMQIKNEIWSAITHGIGIILSILGMILLILKGIDTNSITLFSSIGFLFIYEYNSFVSPRKYSAIG